MTETVIARRYANALFSLGKRHGGGALNERGTVLADLAAMIREEPKLGLVLKSPVISADEKKALLAALLERMGADQTLRNFCFLLADKERLGALSDIADWYGILLDETNGVLRGKVITAVRLPPERREEVRASLAEKAGRDMELVFSVDPSILGGMVLAVGDRVMDGSLRAQLGILRENLKRGM